MAWHDGQLHSRKPQAYRSSVGLTDEAFTHERDRWYSGVFGCRTRPQHGGRTAPSTSHSGDHGVGPVLLELGRNTANDFVFLIAVSRAKHVVVNEFGIRKAPSKLF